MARKKIGALLEEKGLITEFQLIAALSNQRKWKIRLGKALIELGYLEEKKLFEVIAEQWEMELVDLNQIKITDALKKKISRDKAVALMAVPVRQEGETLVFAVSEPDRPNLKEELEKITGTSVRLVMGTDSQVEEIARTLPEKVSVGTVKPVKKAFRKNDDGDIELVEKGEESEILLGGKKLIAKPSEEPIPIGEEPVPLEEISPAQEPEFKTGPGVLSVEVPEIGEEEPEPEVKISPAPEIAEAKKETAGEDTDELWESAQPMPVVEKPSPEPEIPAQMPSVELKAEPEQIKRVEEPGPASMADFFPGQMRDLEPLPEEKTTEPQAEENVVELVSDLKGTELAEEVERIKKEQPPPVERKEPDTGFLAGTGPEILLSKETPAPETAVKPSAATRGGEKPSAPGASPTEAIKEEPLPMAQQVESIQVETELSKTGPGELEKKEILQIVIEIDNKLKRLREMVKELKEKLES